ncbi:MAG TPA: hypothetical protein VMU62_05885, partial [Acidobacteriaceae bacterium]|nr:hypothetical protein [Acidobacteriaceae bacterium]
MKKRITWLPHLLREGGCIAVVVNGRVEVAQDLRVSCGTVRRLCKTKPAGQGDAKNNKILAPDFVRKIFIGNWLPYSGNWFHWHVRVSPEFADFILRFD